VALALELAELFKYARGMSCDCEQKIAELRAKVDALRDVFVQVLDEMVDKFLETIVRDLGKHVDTIEAKQQMLLWRVDERVERVFARLEAATQDPPSPIRFGSQIEIGPPRETRMRAAT
jgi:hypothetical protein